MHASPAYAITYADLERLKIAASRLFHRSVSPQARLEIIARSAGFRTYAAFLTALKQAPVALWGDQKTEEACLKAFEVPGDRVPYIPDVSLNALLSASLALPEKDNVEGAMLRRPEARLEAFRQNAATLADVVEFFGKAALHACDERQFIYKSSLNYAQMRSPGTLATLRRRPELKNPSLILISPENQIDMGHNFDTDASDVTRPGPWMAALVHLAQDERDVIIPLPQDMIVIDWQNERLCRELFSHRKVCCFDEQDRAAAEAHLDRIGKIETSFQIAKPDALELEGEKEMSFFFVGYYGAARLERPENIAALAPIELATLTLTWMSEIAITVRAYRSEKLRISEDRTWAPNRERHALRDKLLLQV